MWAFIPPLDALPRDLQEVTRRVPFWVLCQMIAYLDLIAHPDFFIGSDSEIFEAYYDLQEALALLMEEAPPTEGYMIADIIPHVAAELPDNRLICDGTTRLREDYPLLYDAIDPIYHIDEDSFRVPDLRDKFIKGEYPSEMVDDTGGEKTHTLTIDQIPAHTHTQTPFKPAYITGANTSHLMVNTGAYGNSAYEMAISSTGGGAAHNNEPQYYVLRFAIVAS